MGGGAGLLAACWETVSLLLFVNITCSFFTSLIASGATDDL